MKTLRLVMLALAVLPAACGGSAPAPKAPVAKSEAPAPPPPAPEAAPTHSIARSQIRAVVNAGLGAFLQRVTLDDQAVFKDGKFHGFRVQSLNDAKLFDGVDLKSGDVVTAINGFPIEHPEDADAALRSLEKAPSLKVDLERDGKARTLELPIVD